MPQLLLPLESSENIHINSTVNVWKNDDQWTYFLGEFPIYTHRGDDLKMFRLTIAQLIESGACRQMDIIKAFGMSKSSVIRFQNKLRKHGSEAFFIDHRGRKQGTVLIPELIERSQELLNNGASRKDVAKKLGVKLDTLRKAINDGRLKENNDIKTMTTKSARSVIDSAASDGMGTACTRVIERTLTSVGKYDGADVQFEHCLDVPKAGVLCALPALLVNGLLTGVDRCLGAVKGYYTTYQILLLLAFMALCRIKTMEKLRGHAPGEFGKLLGLDRIPEVRCLRNKLDDLSSKDAAENWAVQLSQDWMQANPESAGTLYIDGHVRVYHGGLTKPPRRYVSRERLCLRGTTDYWVNDIKGRPFFVIEKPVDPGLLDTLRTDIVPRLLQDVPNQPTDNELNVNPLQCRFILVFDREGYSPLFFKEMWEKHRISCMTYHKYPDKDWPTDWFMNHQVSMPNGEVIEMKLAEMGSRIGPETTGMWVREVRKLTESGHQTSIISTAYELEHTQLSARMFSRWCQENFFRYMMEHFAIDLLQEQGTEEFPGTQKVVSPKWRILNRSRGSVQSKLIYRRARFAELALHPVSENSSKKYEKWIKTKAELLEQIEQYECQLGDIKKELKDAPKHITWEALEDKDKFFRLLPGRKRLMDTVRMIAYRAETSMASLLKGSTVDMPAARRILQDLYVTEADILPQREKKRLIIRVHGASRPTVDNALEKLFYEINRTEIVYPGTEMKMFYELISKDIG